MSEDIQFTSLSNPSYRPMVDIATIGGEEDRTPTALRQTDTNATAPEYSSKQSEKVTDSQLPPTYSSVSKWNDEPNRIHSAEEKSEYPAHLAITQQPGREMTHPQPLTTQMDATPDGNWMPIPSGTIGCPPGLEYLSLVDQLIVHQKVELLEVLCGWETNNKYTIKNSLGQKVYAAKEDTDCCTRQCCGSLRPFGIDILDNYGTPVFHLYRELRCDGCCCPCCLQKLEVSSTQGLIGVVEQEWTFWKPRFRVMNPSGEIVLRIQGPFCTCSCGKDVVFSVLDLADCPVGKITKQWSGLGREMLTDADNFSISFPINLDVKIKATLLGALFLIDFMFYEMTKNNQSTMSNDVQSLACCCELCMVLAR